nr:hypothetical protein [Pandoravirus belohorizontensis]
MATQFFILAGTAATAAINKKKPTGTIWGHRQANTIDCVPFFVFPCVFFFLIIYAAWGKEKKRKACKRTREARGLVQGADKDHAVVGLGAHHQAVGTGSGRGQALDELVLGGGRLDHLLVVDANPFAGEALHQFLLVRLIVLPLPVGLCFTTTPLRSRPFLFCSLAPIRTTKKKRKRKKRRRAYEATDRGAGPGAEQCKVLVPPHSQALPFFLFYLFIILSEDVRVCLRGRS